MSLSFDIDVPRQGDFVREYALLDDNDEPINLTGATLMWSARSIAGSGEVLASATINLVEPTGGRFTARWHGPDFDAFGLPTEVVRVAHDLKITFSDSLVDVPLRGQLIIYPEVTA